MPKKKTPTIKRTWMWAVLITISGTIAFTILLSQRQTRATFLADPTHGRVFYFTPKHASWMNRIEIWFSILVRKLLKRGHFKLRAKTRLHEIEQTLLGASSNDDHFPVLKMRKVICLHCLHC